MALPTRLLSSFVDFCLRHAAVLVVCRGMGEPKAGLNNAIVVGVVNLVLDPLLMFGCGLGVTGAAMATAAAQWVSVGLPEPLTDALLTRAASIVLRRRPFRFSLAQKCVCTSRGVTWRTR